MNAQATQWLVNIILALGQGDPVSAADQDKAATLLCEFVKDQEGERIMLTIGKYKIWCNNTPPKFSE